jgi:hypothetical protein
MIILPLINRKNINLAFTPKHLDDEVYFIAEGIRNMEVIRTIKHGKIIDIDNDSFACIIEEYVKKDHFTMPQEEVFLSMEELLSAKDLHKF